MKFLLSIFLPISGLAVRGEQIIRCNSNLMNLCGSDMVIYKSECDFLASKAKFSDLTILDLSDCISSNYKVINSSSNLNITNGASHLNSRLLRGSGMLKRDSEVNSDMIVSVKNETQENLVELVDKKVDNSDKNSTLEYESSSDNENIQDLRLAGGVYSDEIDREKSFYMGSHDSVYKGINKYNVNMINVIVENFDISSFVLSDGKYNLSRLSLLVLKTIIKILENQKSKMLNYLNQLNNVQIDNNNDKNLTSPDSGYNGLEEIQNSYTHKADNFSVIDQRMHNSLNVTFRFVNFNNTDNYLNSLMLVDFALQTLGKMSINNLKDIYNSTLKNDLNNSTNIGNINGDKKKTMNRLLLPLEEESTFEELNSSNGTNNYLDEADNCELNISSNKETPAIPNFHCIFPKNSTDNFKMASNYILNLTELTLKDTFDNKFGNSLTLFPHSIFNPTMNTTNPLETSTRALLSNQSKEIENRVDLVLDFFDLLFSPLNITNDDLKDLEIGEIFVNFDLNFLKDESINSTLTNMDDTGVLEALDEIFELGSIINNFTLSEQKSNSTANSTSLNPLRIASEATPKIKANSTVEELFREFPPAFDRVRGEGCIVKCDDQVDLHCGNNGVTYKNLCEFRNAQCTNKNLIFVNFGKCLPLIIRG
ncbi:uncharacterized protein cubi_02105 [Cryptosporidium ubiquitum]|uniref:Kazal-like domain-containing protein n=1 Tax=Cryptosporidium ubiquitum TaxID=857276 RepID=A0A1J4MN38_9CRYT|nr:uncharacterized protein cubi_02105 [Cryptosporidium ubiquitum]OII75584.1 hypothetical protein cubi_02105 [Cryptosporidium ubiquitum]